MTSSNRSSVTRSQCQQWRDESAAGEQLAAIARRDDVGRTTVSKHVNGRCADSNHADGDPKSLSTECPFCGVDVSFLPNHLPCDGTPPDRLTGLGADS